jgi:hypothetical protein
MALTFAYAPWDQPVQRHHGKVIGIRGGVGTVSLRSAKPGISFLEQE